MVNQDVDDDTERDSITGGRLALAALAAGAGVVHLAMVPSHAQEWWALGIAFAVVGWLQVTLAVALVARPDRRVVTAGVALSALTVLAWAWTRTVGWPIGPDAGEREATSLVDGACSGLEIAFVLFGTLTLVRPVGPRWLSRRVAVVSAVAIAAVGGLTTAALASPSALHDHDEGEAHAHESDAVHAHDAAAPATHESDADHAAGDGHATDTDDGPAAATGHHAECTAPVTAPQQAAADSLVAETRADVARYADVDAATAAGYRPITPPDVTIVHYGQPTYLADGATLDPTRPESLVYAHGPRSDWVLLGAMYMMDDPGATPPEPGGCLTQWHEHTNLCIEPGVGMVGIVDAAGNCPAGSVNETTVAMMHVWSIDLPQGPFAELDQVSKREVVAAVLAAE